jgi:hypothetical protein
MRREFAVAFAIAALPLVLVAQEPPAPVGPRQTPLKVQLTVARFMGDKKISSVPYMLGVLTNAQKTSLRVGVQVPVTTTLPGPKLEGGVATTPSISYSYRDVGTNIDCQAQDAGNGLFNLAITVEDSSIHIDKAGSAAADKRIAADVPAFRSFRASFAMVLRDGQTMQYASATDPISGEVMRIDVALSLAK